MFRLPHVSCMVLPLGESTASLASILSSVHALLSPHMNRCWSIIVDRQNDGMGISGKNSFPRFSSPGAVQTIERFMINRDWPWPQRRLPGRISGDVLYALFSTAAVGNFVIFSVSTAPRRRQRKNGEVIFMDIFRLSLYNLFQWE